MMTKKRIRRILDNKESIEGMSNPFEHEVFYDLLELKYWVKYLYEVGDITKEETTAFEQWETTTDKKAQNKVVNELYGIFEYMGEEYYGY